LFYWLFKNTSLGNDVPLVLWINGGPGSTSMFGLWLENGPIRVRQTGPGNDKFDVHLSPVGSWNDIADVMYIDQPAGTGFSYYDKQPPQNNLDAATEVVQLLGQLLDKFPEYNQRQFIISGESYAGKYIPTIARVV
jgi:carboxypeptidase C (cathepsin A)